VNHRAIGHFGPTQRVAVDLVWDHIDVQQITVHAHAPGTIAHCQADVIDRE